MRKLMSVSAIMAILTLPGYATIQSGSTCDTTNLGQSENNSTANVEADWTANTININWYIDDEAQTTMATNTCTYDGTITLPTQPTKTGYTFAGWQLRAKQQSGQSVLAQSCTDLLTQPACSNVNGCYWIDNTCTSPHDYCVQAQNQADCATRSGTLAGVGHINGCGWSEGSGCDAVLGLLG